MDAELAKEKAEIDEKIADFRRELAMAEADVRAAEAAYSAIAAGVAGQEIVSPRAGIVSAIFKNIGDHVTPETVIAGVSGTSSRGRFVRFRIPSDVPSPVRDETVHIERPGFPFSGKKARVIGVGRSLDDNGFFAADAEFLEPVDWPVHASVRVVMALESVRVTVPFPAIWWDDSGAPNVWLVMENDVIRPQAISLGRAIGDRMEVTDGLQPGDRFVAKATSDLRTGASTARPAAERPEDGEIEGDGHGHSHDD
jgi:multidrug efflux pump subunit AcrA (membrane-fusion protein)